MGTLLTYRRPTVLTSSMMRAYRRSQLQDPTRTTTLRKAFERDMSKRFANITREIKRAVVDLDVFGLKDAQGSLAAFAARPQQFAFSTMDGKVSGFMKWLKELVDQELLTIGTLPQLGQGGNAAWTNLYVQDSYKRGLMRARYEMKNAGYPVPGMDETGGISASMSTPFHMDRVGVLYTRTFEELKGITAAMDTQISRVLSQGMIDGDGPTLLARKMRAVIDGTGLGSLGITDTLGRFIPARRRAQVLARTEIIRAHHIGMVNEYENWKLAGVEVKAEWRTGQDDRVCPICAGMQGRVYTLKEIRGMIPAHPQCRCIAVPTRPDLKKGKIREQANWKNIQKAELPKYGHVMSKDTFDQLKELGISYIETIGTTLIEELNKINTIGRVIREEILEKLPKLKRSINLSVRANVDYVNFNLNSTQRLLDGRALAHYQPMIRSIIFSQDSMNRLAHAAPSPGSFHAAGKSFSSIISHEYAHYVWQHHTVRQQKAVWNQLYQARGGKNNSYFRSKVSRYGATDNEEAFAEAFSLYTHPKYATKPAWRLPKDIEEILEQIIGKRTDL